MLMAIEIAVALWRALRATAIVVLYAGAIACTLVTALLVIAFAPPRRRRRC